jgi:hypothetical protein
MYEILKPPNRQDNIFWEIKIIVCLKVVLQNEIFKQSLKPVAIDFLIPQAKASGN